MRLGLLLVLLLSTPAVAQRRTFNAPPPQDPLRFQYLGPESAGRIASVAGVPGDPSTYYAGAASGGIWKTTDSAQTFKPIFDAEPVQAIGALAVAASDPNIVWAGTGEAWAIRDADVMGDGIYKSTDAGATWTNMGLRETGRIGRIIVHPTNPNIVFACALGRTTGPQEERGVYRTTDGGQHWDRVLFVNPNTGCSGLSMDATDPNVLVAGTWEVVMHTWAMFSGGPGSGIYASRDGGTTWKRIVDPGLPKSPVGKIDVAIAPSDSRRVYALIQTADQGSVWRSDDGGTTWRVVSWDRTLIGRAGYYIRLAINPKNADEVMVANSSFHRSTDGGVTFPFGGGCGDCHDIWVDPTNPDRWVITDDPGMSITTDHAQSYNRITLPIGQMYHVAVDTRVPYWVYSNRQDDGTMRGPSDGPIFPANVPSYRPGGGGGRGRFGGGFGGAASRWEGPLGGCESGFTLPDPTNADVVWATCYGNKVTRYDARFGQARSVSPWIHTLDSPPNDTRYRCHWTAPLAIDPFDHETVYYGCQVIFKTSNSGQSWTVISPDLSTNDPKRIVSSGGIIGDNLGQFYGEVVFAIAPSALQRGLIWAGTNDGQIWLTRDGGDNWTNVTKNVTGMPAWGTIRRIEPSTFDAGTAYVSVDYHLMDNRDPYVYKTTDFGQTWTRVSDGLPHGHPLDYVMAVAENPNRRGMLFAGTGHGFFYSLDDGGHWTQFQPGLPAAPVSWIIVEKTFHDVIISTYGRGLYVLRDVTPLESGDATTAAAPLVLYTPPPGYREARAGHAAFTFKVPGANDSIQVEILDAHGTVIRTLKSGAREGLNRVTWDLRYEGPRQVELRTVPPDNPHIWEEARFKDHDTRPVNHWGIQSPQRVGPLAAPGDYAVRITVNGASQTQPFHLIRGTGLPSPDADLVASTETQVRIRDDINKAADLINRLEVMRKQVEDQLAAHKGDAKLTRSLNELGKKMMDVELQLLSRTEMHSDDKWYVEGYKVYLNLLWLAGQVGTGASDVAGGAEYRPTDTQLAVLETIERDLTAADTAFTRLVERDVPAFNKAVAGKLPPITVGS